MEKIDFVILWVDGSDSKWLAEKKKYQPGLDVDSSIARYRDWDNLKYWFRGVEKYANWVNKVYFVTCGQIPTWLNTNNNKLVLVDHKDFIPEKYLPTFNSNAIEMNLHRIKDLSENFVLFNDDMFIVNQTKPQDFFYDDLPMDSAILRAHVASGDVTDYIISNNMAIINKHFNSHRVMKKDFFKWYNLKYGKFLYNNIFLHPYDNFTGIRFEHLTSSFKKSTFEKIWNLEGEKLDQTCSHRFRSTSDINQWLVKSWQVCEGKFEPRNPKWGGYYCYNNDTLKNLKEFITGNKYKVICLNDATNDEKLNFEQAKKYTKVLFDSKFPIKSGFELKENDNEYENKQ